MFSPTSSLRDRNNLGCVSTISERGLLLSSRREDAGATPRFVLRSVSLSAITNFSGFFPPAPPFHHINSRLDPPISPPIYRGPLSAMTNSGVFPQPLPCAIAIIWGVFPPFLREAYCSRAGGKMPGRHRDLCSGPCLFQRSRIFRVSSPPAPPFHHINSRLDPPISPPTYRGALSAMTNSGVFPSTPLRDRDFPRFPAF